MNATKLGIIMLAVAVVVIFFMMTLRDDPPVDYDTAVVADTAVSGSGVVGGVLPLDTLPGIIPPAANQHTAGIRDAIDSLRALPDSVSGKRVYDRIADNINDLHGRHLFSPRELPSANDDWKVFLTGSLHDAYADKFIRRAVFVFGRGKWSASEVAEIGAGCRDIRAKEMLYKGEKRRLTKPDDDRRLAGVLAVVAKYQEIDAFVKACNGYRVPSADLASQFPVKAAGDSIAKAGVYQNVKFQLEGRNIDLCSDMKGRLRGLPGMFFKSKHVQYLDNKISRWSGKYEDPAYTTHPAYQSRLFSPVQAEINALSNSVYNVSAQDFARERNRLLSRWNPELEKAAFHFTNKKEVLAYLNNTRIYDGGQLRAYRNLPGIPDDIKASIELGLESVSLGGSSNKSAYCALSEKAATDIYLGAGFKDELNKKCVGEEM